VIGADSGAPRFGVIEWAGVWYPWMREDHETVMALQKQRECTPIPHDNRKLDWGFSTNQKPWIPGVPHQKDIST